MPTYQLQADHYLTSDQTLLSNKEYKKVASVMDTVVTSGAVSLGAGACVGMCRLIYAALKHQGINSRLVECQATYTYHKGEPNEVTSYIGFDDIKNPGEIDTHVVVVTDTIPSFMIDASLTHRYGGIIIDKVTAAGVDGTFGDYFFQKENLKCLYQIKPIQKIPLAQQMSFIDRMQTDDKIFGNLKLLRWLMGFAITVSLLNASRGLYDHYQKYWDETGNWGPDAIEKLDKKLDKLADVIDKHQADHKK